MPDALVVAPLVWSILSKSMARASGDDWSIDPPVYDIPTMQEGYARPEELTSEDLAHAEKHG